MGKTSTKTEIIIGGIIGNVVASIIYEYYKKKSLRSSM